MAAEYRDDNTHEHTERVADLAARLARHLGHEDRTVWLIRQVAPLHDLGKIAIPDTVLLKPGRLTPEEYDAIKEHSAEGARIVAKFSRLRDAVPVIRHHHERWDGRGYPDGLAAAAIPPAAAIVGLADAWDAMTTERPYNRALDLEEAFAEIREGRGTQFAPDVVDAFFRAVRTRPGEFGAAEDHGISLAAG
jgi:putative two-component system response regulator